MREMVITQEDVYREVSLLFRAPGMRCDSCDYETVTVAQAPEYNRAMADAYRVREGLLTSGEIRTARGRLDMSQQDFADYLGVGVASVKRWEWGQVQEKSLDKLMRVLTDPDEAERVARSVRNLVGSSEGKGNSASRPVSFENTGMILTDLLNSQFQLPGDWSLQGIWSALLQQSAAVDPSHFAERIFARQEMSVDTGESQGKTPMADSAARALRLVA
jgi:putative zinc finger/helix-turn-helix YgiT family protein